MDMRIDIFLASVTPPAKLRFKRFVRRLIHPIAFQSQRIMTRLHTLLAPFLVVEKESWPSLRQDIRHEGPLPISLNGESPGGALAIAFFLPQFHRDSVNDKAWGPGFTEWTNVAKARPLYHSHQHPKLPADLGFYNLNCTQAWSDQADLASRYGIHGFAIYHYWFSGERPLEASLLTLLSHSEIDLRFCLCWANESWTRRWDGGNKEIIFKQEYHKDNPVQLAHYLAPFMSDKRYIRVDGKPIYLIYRVDEIPDAKAFIRNLRQSLLEHGHKISLGRVLSFRSNPHDALSDLFDFSVQFPVHGTYGQAIPCHAVKPIQKIYDPLKLSRTTLLDYHDWAIQQSQLYDELLASSRGGCPVFPGIMPDFDNTARRGNNGGALFINHTEKSFFNWVVSSLESLNRINFAGLKYFVKTPLIFIASWNEWAEGSVMEPSLHLGYYYLNEFYRASVQASPTRKDIFTSTRYSFKQSHRDALIYHLYYPDMVNSATETLRRCASSFDIYLSISDLIGEPDLRKLAGICPTAIVIEQATNRGFDLLPFFRFLTDADLGLLSKYRWILKLHAKRSSQRPDGIEWSRALEACLVDLDLDSIEDHVGFISPEMSTLSVRDFVGSNAGALSRVAKMLGVSDSRILDTHFAAGSMYLIRAKCLQGGGSKLEKIASLLSETSGYSADGTYAHAIERCMQIFAYRTGYIMRSTLDVARKHI